MPGLVARVRWLGTSKKKHTDEQWISLKFSAASLLFKESEGWFWKVSLLSLFIYISQLFPHFMNIAPKFPSLLRAFWLTHVSTSSKFSQGTLASTVLHRFPVYCLPRHGETPEFCKLQKMISFVSNIFSSCNFCKTCSPCQLCQKIFSKHLLIHLNWNSLTSMTYIVTSIKHLTSKSIVGPNIFCPKDLSSNNGEECQPPHEKQILIQIYPEGTQDTC